LEQLSSEIRLTDLVDVFEHYIILYVTTTKLGGSANMVFEDKLRVYLQIRAADRKN
jgi:hypothetical protein